MNQKTIGERIKAFRKEKRLIGKAFGEPLNLGKAGIAHIEAGRQKLSVEQLKTLIQLYPELNVYWLLTGEGQMYNQTELEVSDGPKLEKVKGDHHRYEILLKEYQALLKRVRNLNFNFSLHESALQ
jgi:transcriptional regulator with XRE-family HTH domain